ncbi:type II toxin-antitoxin system HipA family toxin [Orrella marina]|uniref:Type II toxin-antitoxin system HipA family toxin n=1 Tax=Orrella marina TaxID=2163011 RepID=A0A2R4XFC7_9BURK|nr:type II toxin-antitoxin system HipA family toxin [Orrella marina]AWB32505.1 hypothetical protein DBV39_00865 [Orrella marina]
MRSLNIFVNKRHVATLHEEAATSGRPGYRLLYEDHVRPDEHISLTLPVSKKAYFFDDMPFCLKQNFPEGERLQKFLELRRYVDVSDDFGILSIIGQNMVGRVSVSPGKEPPNATTPIIALDEITKSGREHFERILLDYGSGQGVSGVQKKILAQTDPRAGKRDFSKRDPRTVLSEKFIIKGFVEEDFPALAENEFWTMRASQRSVINTANTHLSQDLSVIAVERFDTLPDSDNRLCLDEAGALMGFSNDQKYLASYEVVADAIYRFCGNKKADGLAFFSQLAFMVATQNGDAHLKNFAILSDGKAQPRLSPAYDLVSTCAYVDYGKGEFENPALTLDNERWEKHWWSLDALFQFGRYALELDEADMESVVGAIGKGLTDTVYEMQKAAKSPSFRDLIMPKMVEQWLNPFSGATHLPPGCVEK